MLIFEALLSSVYCSIALVKMTTIRQLYSIIDG